MRYRLSSTFGFQPQLVTELGYGKAIHHILQRVAELAKAAKKLPTLADIENVFEEGFYLPFAHKFAFERLFGEAKKLVDQRQAVDLAALHIEDHVRTSANDAGCQMKLERALRLPYPQQIAAVFLEVVGLRRSRSW